MKVIIFDSEKEAQTWFQENTSAGYASHEWLLTESDLEQLSRGKVLVIGGEYGSLVMLKKYWLKELSLEA